MPRTHGAGEMGSRRKARFMDPPKRPQRTAKRLSFAQTRTTERHTVWTPTNSPDATKALHLRAPFPCATSDTKSPDRRLSTHEAFATPDRPDDQRSRPKPAGSTSSGDHPERTLPHWADRGRSARPCSLVRSDGTAVVQVKMEALDPHHRSPEQPHGLTWEPRVGYTRTSPDSPSPRLLPRMMLRQPLRGDVADLERARGLEAPAREC
jgi:hypothetical protein